MSRFRALWQASVDAARRALTWNLEDLVPPAERYVFKFDSKEELKRWHLYSDSEYGGFSSASLLIKENGSSGTENWVNSPGQQEDNSWQAFVLVPEGNWYIAKIPLSRYLPAWRVNVIDANLEMNPSRIVGMSLSVMLSLVLVTFVLNLSGAKL